MKLEKITAKGAEHLYRHPKTGIIYFRQFKKGFGELTRSTRTNNLLRAKGVADQIGRGFFFKGKARPGKKTALEQFDDWVERKKSSNKRINTITSINSSRKYFKVFLFDMVVGEITAKWWESVYIPSVRAVTHEKRKFFNDRKWLISFLRSLRADGLIEKVPALLNPDGPRAPGKVYSDKEIRALLGNSEGELRLKIQMAITMGMRKSEILKLQFDRINFETKTIALRAEDTKTKKPREFGVSKSVWPQLKAKREPADGSPFIFPNKNDQLRAVHVDGFKTAWTNLKKKCGISGKTFHHLRHTFLTNAFKHPKGNIAFICEYAGLSLEEAQKTYLHLTPDDTRIVAELVSYE